MARRRTPDARTRADMFAKATKDDYKQERGREFCTGCHTTFIVGKNAIPVLLMTARPGTGIQGFACPTCGTVKIIPGLFVKVPYVEKTTETE